jgi:hypothetical protein
MVLYLYLETPSSITYSSNCCVYVVSFAQIVERMFDAFLSSHPALPLYMCAATILHAKDMILACESDFSEMHQCLVKLTRDANFFTASKVEEMLITARQLFHDIPPHLLKTLPNIGEDTLFSLDKLVKNHNSPELLKQESPDCVSSSNILSDLELLEERRKLSIKSGVSTSAKSLRLMRRRAKEADISLNRSSGIISSFGGGFKLMDSSGFLFSSVAVVMMASMAMVLMLSQKKENQNHVFYATSSMFRSFFRF